MDPLNREVTVIRPVGALVAVKLNGPYGATVLYPPTCLRALDHEQSDTSEREK